MPTHAKRYSTDTCKRKKNVKVLSHEDAYFNVLNMRYFGIFFEIFMHLPPLRGPYCGKPQPGFEPRTWAVRHSSTN
jgi:hypothetical protein